MKQLFKRLFCKHEYTMCLHNLFGNKTLKGWFRGWYVCEKCGKQKGEFLIEL